MVRFSTLLPTHPHSKYSVFPWKETVTPHFSDKQKLKGSVLESATFTTLSMSFLTYKTQKQLVCSFYVFFLFIIGCSCILTHLYVIKTVVRLFVWMLVQSKVTESPHSLRSYPLSRVQILLFRRMFLNNPLQSQSFFFHLEALTTKPRFVY